MEAILESSIPLQSWNLRDEIQIASTHIKYSSDLCRTERN